MTKCALIWGAGGFIGGRLVKRLKNDGFWIRRVDLKFHEFSETQADDFVVGDLRDQSFCRAWKSSRSGPVNVSRVRSIAEFFHSSSFLVRAYETFNLSLLVRPRRWF